MSGYVDSGFEPNTVLAPGTGFAADPFAAAELARRVREALDPGRSRLGTPEESSADVPAIGVSMAP